VFNLHGADRLIEWKQFRDSLEISQTPFEDLVNFWSHAPFVSAYLNPLEPESWPDPWHLVLDGKLDELAISLGMLYTLKLTQRFMGSSFEIHTSMFSNKKSPSYFLVVDHSSAVNQQTREVLEYNKELAKDLNKIWTAK
jgi:hypothetical protein